MAISMTRSAEQLREDALAIWQAAVAAVESARLVRQQISVESGQLRIASEVFPLNQIGRIVVVGAGKAGAGMAAGFLEALGPTLIAEKQVSGWLNVPADCVRSLPPITLHAARPAGLNEPTAEGVKGSEEILKLVSHLTADDLCVCLLSGGGSALLPAPCTGLSLADKQAVTKFLSAAGANIYELNTVRKQLSRIKGGGLARNCRAGHLLTLVISDVIGDPLDVIASGPTVPNTTSVEDARRILERFAPDPQAIPAAIWKQLSSADPQSPEQARLPARLTATAATLPVVSQYVIGNNTTAVEAARREAMSRGYEVHASSASQLEGAAERVGEWLADQASQARQRPHDTCWISGGEPTVQLVPAERRGKGGRNQQLVLAACERLNRTRHEQANPCEGIVILSGGTDGEDGPTDAAGAWLDASIWDAARQHGLHAADFLARNDAYHFFAPLDALIRSGPTHTNVCDIRVATISSAGNH
jgi:glycerate 2-kinase